MENLTPWKPGQSGNPAGSSRGRRLRASLVRKLLELDDVEALAVLIVDRALAGEFRAWRIVFEIDAGPARLCPRDDPQRAA